jgi:hypothetical protein
METAFGLGVRDATGIPDNRLPEKRDYALARPLGGFAQHDPG